MNLTIQKFSNILALALVLWVNFWAVSLPLNGLTPKDISQMFPNEFAPAPITFSIWSIIYSLILGIMVWQFGRKNPLRDQALQKISAVFIINCGLNASWLISWHYLLLWLSVLIMLGILVTLIYLNRLISSQLSPQTPQIWLLKAGFGLYLGWICVATVANATVLLVSTGFKGVFLSETFWTGGMIGIAAIVVALTTWHFKNLFIALAVIWAFAGIIIQQNILHNSFTPISWAALTWAMPLVVSMVYSQTFKLKKA
jgi:hypothetical protein